MRRCVTFSPLWLALSFTAVAAHAQPADPKEQARGLYGQGIERYDRGDFEGAVDAYRQAYALVHYPVIMFNLALAYEALGKPVDAMTAFEQVLAEPGTLRPERIDRAKRSLDAQRRLVAELQVSCNVEGATIRVDGREVGSYPLPKPVKVASGRVILQATKDGYQAGYKTVTAPGGAALPVSVELMEAAGRPAQLKVHSTLPDAELWIDGQLVAVTPLRSTVPVTAGEAHRVELRRDGYLPAVETLTLAEGAQSELTLQPQESRDAVLSTGGELVLKLAQQDASVFVDGARRELPSGGSLRLPAGLHVVSAEREGYDPLQLRLQVPARGRLETKVDLVPTPETRARMIGDAEFDRSLGWGLTAGGVVLVGVGAGLFGWSRVEYAAARDERAAIDAGEPPYQACANNLMAGTDDDHKFCKAARLAAGNRQDLMLGVSVGSGIGIAVGLAGAITGIYFLATGEDPDSFRLIIDDDVFALSLSPALEAGPQRGFIGLRGAF